MSNKARAYARKASFYIFIQAVGIILYKYAAAYAYTERGYIAVGGEFFLLLLPVFVYLIGSMMRGAVQTAAVVIAEWQKENRRRKVAAEERRKDGKANEA